MFSVRRRGGAPPRDRSARFSERGVMRAPKIPNGPSRRIGERKRTEWLYAAEMETLRMITDGASLANILTHVCASIDRDLSVNHYDPVDGARWAETPADCRSEGAARVD